MYNLLLIVNDSVVRLWKNRRSGFDLPNQMIYHSLTMQIKKNQETFWDRGVPPTNGLVHFDKNTKQNFVEFLVIKDAKSLY